MGFSPKRAKAVVQGKVNYVILADGKEVFASKNFMVAVSHADFLQQANPGICYTMTITEQK